MLVRVRLDVDVNLNASKLTDVATQRTSVHSPRNDDNNKPTGAAARRRPTRLFTKFATGGRIFSH